MQSQLLFPLICYCSVSVKEVALVLISDTDLLTPKRDAVVELIPYPDKPNTYPEHLTIFESLLLQCE